MHTFNRGSNQAASSLHFGRKVHIALCTSGDKGDSRTCRGSSDGIGNGVVATLNRALADKPRESGSLLTTVLTRL